MEIKKSFVDIAIKRITYVIILSLLTIIAVGEIAQAFGESISK